MPLSASIGGSIAGLAVGFRLFPTVIFNALPHSLLLPSVRISFPMEYALVTSAARCCATVLAAWFACYGALAENPAQLMLPRAPKAGQNAFSWTHKFFWSHMSFTQKVYGAQPFPANKRDLYDGYRHSGCTACS
jgi:putative ABC transport system permease protein